MRDSIDLYYNEYNIHYYNEQYIEQYDTQQYDIHQYDIHQYETHQYDESSIFSFNEEQENKVKYTELYNLYNDDKESTDNYKDKENNNNNNNNILQLPISYEQYLLMKKEWNKQLDTLSFSNLKTNNTTNINNNNPKKSIKNLFSKFLKKNNNNNKNKNVSFYRILIN